MVNILITGASGMLGASMVKRLKDEYNIFATGNSYFENQHYQYKKFDLKSNSYKELIEWSNPDIIIHCGALTNGNYCENNPDEAFIINGTSLSKFINATNREVKLIYISTDAVFPSSIKNAKETDYVFPESIYGKSKELGEYFLKNSSGRDYAIIRTTIVGLNSNKNKNGFVDWIINSSISKQNIGLFTDVVFSPISIWHLIDEIKYLIDSDNINSEILHIAGDSCSKYDFGKKLLKTLNLSLEYIKKSKIENFTERAKRSNDQTLDSHFYKARYSRNLPSLDELLLKIKEYYEKNKIR